MPFDPKQVCLLPQQQEILDTLRVHCQQGGLCLILGEPGTGKSVLKQALIDSEPKRLIAPAIARTLHTYLNTIKILGTVMAPFLPIAAEKVAGMLSAGPEEMVWDAAADPLPEGRALGEPTILFEKIEEPEDE